MTLNKPVIRKIIAEDAANPKLSSLGLSISRSDSAMAESASANEGQKVRRPANAPTLRLLNHLALSGKKPGRKERCSRFALPQSACRSRIARPSNSYFDLVAIVIQLFLELTLTHAKICVSLCLYCLSKHHHTAPKPLPPDYPNGTNFSPLYH
jgi:hypothetical protein